jgi:Flp pilus assembly protein TadG
MRKFFKNTKGAVTVFVTLLLIPALLASGMAVDVTVTVIFSGNPTKDSPPGI